MRYSDRASPALGTLRRRAQVRLQLGWPADPPDELLRLAARARRDYGQPLAVLHEARLEGVLGLDGTDEMWLPGGDTTEILQWPDGNSGARARMFGSGRSGLVVSLSLPAAGG